MQVLCICNFVQNLCVPLKLYKVTGNRKEQVLMDRIKQMLKDRLCSRGKGHERQDRRLMRYVLLLFVNSPNRHNERLYIMNKKKNIRKGILRVGILLYLQQ
jgi:hypothetical protein